MCGASIIGFQVLHDETKHFIARAWGRRVGYGVDERLGLSHLIDVPSVQMPHDMETGSPKKGQAACKTPDSVTYEPGDEAASQQSLGPTSWTWPTGEVSTQGSMYEEPQPYIPRPCTSMPQWVEVVVSSSVQSTFSRVNEQGFGWRGSSDYDPFLGQTAEEQSI